MRSRYTAYTLKKEAYLLETWHASTRPAARGLDAQPPGKWSGLEVRQHVVSKADPDRAVVEFVARQKTAGRAHRMHETSRFVREHETWFYVDGEHK